MKKTILVLGAGKGRGNRVAEKFGTNDFRVVLMLGNAEHLTGYKKEFRDKAELRAMCIALHNKLKEQNIYLGTVTVTGVIAPGEKCDPALLAEDFRKFYSERSDCEIVH